MSRSEVSCSRRRGDPTVQDGNTRTPRSFPAAKGEDSSSPGNRDVTFAAHAYVMPLQHSPTEKKGKNNDKNLRLFADSTQLIVVVP